MTESLLFTIAKKFTDKNKQKDNSERVVRFTSWQELQWGASARIGLEHTTDRKLTSCYLQNRGAHAKYKSFYIMSSGHSPDSHIKLPET
jgi:ethanolamine ammonia-lyase small subunit